MIVVDQDKNREFRAKGWWTDATLHGMLAKHVAATPDDEALVDPLNLSAISDLSPVRLSWKEVASGVEQRAAVLTKIGLKKDDIVVIQLPNSVELTLVLLACMTLGVIASPAPAQYRAQELRGIINKTAARAAITVGRIGKHPHAETFLGLKADCPTLDLILVAGQPVEGSISLDRAIGELTAEDEGALADALEMSPVTADDLVTICWTSGTEADPKGVPRNHNEWIIMGQGCAAGAKLQPGERLLNPFPMVNMAGISTGLCSWLEIGGVLVQHHPFDLEVFLKQIEDERINFTVAPPAVLSALLANPDVLSNIDFGRLDRIGSGSAPLSDWMVYTFHDQHGVEIINIFGSNEGASFAACIEDVPKAEDRAVCFPRFGDHGFDWSYRLADRIKTRLVDPETEREILDPETPGELRIKGPVIFSGYWKAPDVTERAFDAAGWFRTGDLFAITGDRNQYYRFVGRLKDIIIRGGMNISAEEIERYLLDHPSILEAAVIGSPDQRLGERLHACVVIKGEEVSIEEINRFLTQEKQIAVYKQIEKLSILPALPRNPVGKIVKRDLREKLGSVL